MNKFELVLLFSPDLSTVMVEKEEDSLDKNITKSKGSIISKEDWGIKDISFKINNFKKDFYKFYQIEMDGQEVDNLKKGLTQNEKILRHLFIKVDNHQQLPTKMMNDEEK